MVGSQLRALSSFERLLVNCSVEHVELQPVFTAFSCVFLRGSTESHEQLFFARELGTADEGECGGRWNQLLCYP